MMKNPIGWIEIPVIDIDRAEKWYKNYFGFDFNRQAEIHGVTMSWFPMEMESYGSAATLIKGAHYKPSTDGPLIYFTSPDETVGNGLHKAKELEIEVLIPKTSIGEHGYFAALKDSEGNRVAIHSMKG